MITIKDEYINIIEKELLPQGCSFNDERRAFIQCMETRDVDACAGSGKTTALIAKLMILDRFFMDFPKNRGICVLTHTNVAINEIKEKLGSGSRLLAYPNFFGTIQDFVNTFLAKPMYKMDYKKNPKYIDLDWHEGAIKAYYIDNKSSYANIRQIEDLFPKTWLEADKRYTYPNYETFLNEMSLKDEKSLLYNDEKFELYEDAEKKIKKTIPHEVQNDLVKLKKCFIKQENAINYDDAYFFARRYKNQCGELLKDLFSQRFQFVFLDEMQDTETHQKEILDTIFDENQTIIQRIGDQNQTIYSRSQDVAWKLKEPCLSITGSKRYHNLIASIADNISVNKIGIQGNSSTEIQPIIIVFENNQIENVIKKFGDIVVENNLHQKNLEKQPIIKAVGGLSYLNGTTLHLIGEYFSNFEKKTSGEKEPYAYTLRGFLKHNPENKSANYYRKAIIGAMLKMLSLVGKSGYNEKTFIKEFKEKAEYNDFLLKMTEWCTKMHLNHDILPSKDKPFEDQSIYSQIKKYLENDLKNYFYPDAKWKNNDNVYKFLNNEEKKDDKPKTNSKYKYTQGAVNFEIEVGTVHSVKGETHTATLYLETPDYDTKEYDLKQILLYLKGNHYKSTKLERVLRIAHVAVTRPTHLLCLAIHKSSLSNFEQDRQELEKAGWQVIIIPPN